MNAGMDRQDAVQAASEVTALVERWAAASRTADLEVIMGCYAEDVRAFDAIGPLQFDGWKPYADHWAYCMQFMAGGQMIFNPHDIRVEADGDVAFAHLLIECGCENAQGEMESGWTRGTMGCRKFGGSWKIMHDHFSAPFDPETGKAALDLKP